MQEDKEKTVRAFLHDLGSPLSALNVICNQPGEMNADKQRLLKMVYQRLKELTEDLKAQSQELERQKENCYTVSQDELSEALNKVVEEKKFLHPNQDISITRNGSANGSYALDINQLKRAFSNLLDNAIEANYKNNPIAIVLVFTPTKIKLVIKDQGKGIPKSVIKKLGTYGYSYNKENGSGIGLYRASEFAKANRGKLSVDSTLGKGTKVTLSLSIKPQRNQLDHLSQSAHNCYLYKEQTV